MGEVILGMPGPWARDYREKADHYTTKIGGLPDWPDSFVSVNKELLLCGLCGGKLCLVAQIYAPLSMTKRSTDERVIYVLGCMKRDCGSNPRSIHDSGVSDQCRTSTSWFKVLDTRIILPIQPTAPKSWKVLRLQKCEQDIETKDEPLKAVQPQEKSTSVVQEKPELQSSSLEECDDEETDSDIDLDELAKALEQAATLASHSKKQNKSKHANKIAKNPVSKRMIDDSTTPVLPCFYIYSKKDSKQSMGKTVSDECSSIPIKEINKSSANENEGEESWEGEAYEYDKALFADRTYLKFKKQLDANPKQCFRYSYGGNPLLPVVKMPKPGVCKVCGSGRRFELQLMPPLLYFLHEADDGSLDISIDGWTWLTIIICTCPKGCCSLISSEETGSSSCWGIVEEEAVVIQDD